MSLFADTRIALESHLNTLPNKPPIAWENSPYSPSENTAFLAAYLIPSPSNIADLQWLQENRGIFQVDIFVPLEKGTGKLNTLADDICDHFKAQVLEQNDAIIEIGACSFRYVGGEGTWYKGIIEIGYLCYSN